MYTIVYSNRTRKEGDRMNEKRSRAEVLQSALMADILRCNLSFKETMSALNYVQTVLNDKCNNLANATNIREVAKWKR